MLVCTSHLKNFLCSICFSMCCVQESVGYTPAECILKEGEIMFVPVSWEDGGVMHSESCMHSNAWHA